MKVIVNDSLVGQDNNGTYSYGKGVNEMPDERAKHLIKCGHAVLIETTERQTATVQHTEKRKK